MLPTSRPRGSRFARPGPAQDDRNQRDRESKRHQADGLRNSEISIIDVSAYRAERDKRGDDLKWRHGALWRVGQEGSADPKTAFCYQSHTLSGKEIRGQGIDPSEAQGPAKDRHRQRAKYPPVSRIASAWRYRSRSRLRSASRNNRIKPMLTDACTSAIAETAGGRTSVPPNSTP